MQLFTRMQFCVSLLDTHRPFSILVSRDYVSNHWKWIEDAQGSEQLVPADFLQFNFKLKSGDGVYHTYAVPIYVNEDGDAGYHNFITQFRMFPAVTNTVTRKGAKVMSISFLWR